jgi:DNA repair photolyase
MQEITRKTMLYKTGVEYGDYTINHVLGCSHGCKYPCYAYLMARRFGKVKSYEDWIKPKIAENALQILDKEIPRLKEKIESVQLCFTTDPFMYGYDEIYKMSIQIIKKLNEAGIKCTALTKGILPIELASLSSDNEYGITLISLNETFRQRIEPNASPYKDRLESLKALHQKGCKTWVSIEPYPTPNIIQQDLDEIMNELGFVDKIIFGRMNYNPKVTAYPKYKQFFNEEAERVIRFCERESIDYHIKNGTITENEESIFNR